VVKHVVKKFSEFRVVRKWWENARFCPENAKNKAENGSFSAFFGTDVHKGFNKHTETVQSYFQKRTFFNNPLLRYNVFAKEDFAL